MATLAEVREDIRSHIDESISRFWSDPELDRWIWEAMRDVARRTETLRDYKTYTVLADQNNYDAPSDLLRIHTVEFMQTNSDRQRLEYVPWDQLYNFAYNGRSSSSGRPSVWSFWGYPGNDSSQIYLFPAPSDTIADGLGIFFYRLPRKPVVETDILDILAGWEDLVPLYVEVVARRKESRDPRWREAMDLYEARIEQMVRTTRQRTDALTYFSGHTAVGAGWWLNGAGDW